MNQIQFLGTGWSHGVPMIGCDCRVCRERKPENVRRRSSLRLTDTDSNTIVIDVGPDFRDQAITFGIEKLDAVMITHQHADHVMGLDDIRRFTWQQPGPLTIWVEPGSLDRMNTLYPYVAQERSPAKAVPLVEFRAWQGPVRVGAWELIPHPVPHGDLPCVGVEIRCRAFRAGYVPDASGLPNDLIAHLQGVDVMILNALRHDPHPSHLSLEQSIELLKQIGATRSFVTHMGCPLDYHTLKTELPDRIEPAKDGLVIEVEEATVSPQSV